MLANARDTFIAQFDRFFLIYDPGKYTVRNDYFMADMIVAFIHCN